MVLRIEVNTPDGRRPVLFRWSVSSFSGWGLYGLNLALQLAGNRSHAPISAMSPGPLVLDPIRSHRLVGFNASTQALNEVLARTNDAITVNAPVLHPLDVDLGSAEGALRGTVDVGVAFITDTNISAAGRERSRVYQLIVAGSAWNADVLRGAGVEDVATILQGVDPGLFHPAPASGLLCDRFVIFSGGKLEYRKGQDLVLAAYKLFQARHPEALLLVAWSSPWTELAAEFDCPPPRRSDGTPDIIGWAAVHGIPSDAVQDLGPVPNIAMPHVLRDADVALFPNRAEGGTNLVAMEAMACGVPTVLSANTGHLDLLAGDAALPLRHQRAVARGITGTDGWGESDVEEILEALETIWRDRAAARAMGLRGAAMMAGLSWQRQIAALGEASGLW